MFFFQLFERLMWKYRLAHCPCRMSRTAYSCPDDERSFLLIRKLQKKNDFTTSCTIQIFDKEVKAKNLSKTLRHLKAWYKSWESKYPLFKIHSMDSCQYIYICRFLNTHSHAASASWNLVVIHKRSSPTRSWITFITQYCSYIANQCCIQRYTYAVVT